MTKPNQPLWRSLPATAAAEPAPHRVPAESEVFGDGQTRRGFMRVMGASAAFGAATLSACRWEKDHIVPMSERPEDWVPGVPKMYASAMELGGVASGLLVTSYDGRPIHVDGNPDHPHTTGATSAFAQASVLELYDPDRSREVVRRQNGQPMAGGWAEFEDLAKAASGQGTRLRFLAEASSSPTLAALRAKLPAGTWHEWEPLSRDHEREGTRLAFGAPHRVQLKLAAARVIAVFDGDLFYDHPDALRLSRDFADNRDPDTGPMNRLYAIESVFSLTGGMADHRLPVRSELIKPILLGLEAKLGGAAPPAAKILGETGVGKFIDALAKDLQQNRGTSVVACGHRQPPEVHALVARINAALGNNGATVAYTPDDERPTHLADLAQLVADLGAGKVDTLVILGGNPAYTAPAELGFAAALVKVPTSVHLSLFHDETSALCSWHLPRAHYLEAWGDARSYDGTITLQQPIIDPIYGGRTAIDVVKLFTDHAAKSTEALVTDTFASYGGGTSWRRALHDGFVLGSATPTAGPAVVSFELAPLTATQGEGTRLANGQMELTFIASSSTYDGRFANNAWLQELPDFLTKCTWDNYALISPKTAAELGIAHEDVVRLESESLTLEVPAYVMPGQAPFSVAIALGYGRTRAGQVGGSTEDDVKPPGFDSYKLRTQKSFWQSSGLKVSKASGTYPLGNTQDHFQLEARGMAATQQRLGEIIAEASAEEYAQKPNFLVEEQHSEANRILVDPVDADRNNLNLWDSHTYVGHKWGMTIDLSKCTGCNSCMVACQAENNVPVVGKTQVIKNREMHWIRIDRYFKGDAENPELLFQPVACQQCENAPCEQVCPVGATMHSTEGLNDMVYNRCVGTRYCENNCPYKVRRFNFLRWDWYKELDETRNKVRALIFNPEVTVRSRGVMEKCTFCIQRIQNVKIVAKNERRPIVDGEITTACQDACPTNAIVFGDLNDGKSKVKPLHESKRGYALLAELNTRPRNIFLARIRNPNPELV